MAIQGGQAIGANSIAIGGVSANGDYSVAIGDALVASGNSTFALGFSASTNNFTGSFVYGDAIANTLFSTANNQFSTRAVGGYALYTTASGAQATWVGAQLLPGANSWSSISDSTRKENFKNVDGNDFLNKIGSMRVCSWNYKSQNSKEFRHYGPMAQDFFNAFGNDGIGVIGNDTTIATADMDGVLFIAVKELTKELKEKKREIEELKSRDTLFEKRISALEVKNN